MYNYSESLLLLSIFLLVLVDAMACVVLFLGDELFFSGEIIFLLILIFLTVVCGSSSDELIY